jgi:hypothetical protein
MKKIFAALTAIALTAGLSLAAVAAPAGAASTPTPTPSASTKWGSKPTPTPTPTAKPTAKPTPTPTAVPTPTATPTPTVTPVSTPSLITPNLVTPSTTTTVTPSFVAKFVTVIWTMPAWSQSGAPTYPQHLVKYYPESTETLSVPLPTTCGGIYQVDSYVYSPSTAAGVRALIQGGVLNGPAGVEDGQFLAPGGSNVAWKTVDQAGCVAPVCIPSSAVSYTYNATDSNDGVITVNDVPNSTGVLCNPFYVTATSWKYTTNSEWPQIVDVVDHLGKISTPGTYPYAALVTCGQGDIYASTDPTNTSLTPEHPGYLSGANNPINEHFLSQMGFAGGHSPTYTADNTNCWVPSHETGAPIDSTLSCTSGSSNSLTLPVVLGGVWTVTNGSYTHVYPISTGVTNFVPTDFQTTPYTITLADGNPHDQYTVTSASPWTWTPVNPAGLTCTTLVTPVSPTANAITQCDVDGSIVINPTVGVVYYIGTNVVSGTVTGLTGTVTVTARAASAAYVLTGTNSWTFHLGQPTTCLVTAVTGDCIPVNGVSSESVTLVFDNSGSSTPSTFALGGTTYTVPGGQVAKEIVGSVGTTGASYDVYVNNSTTPTVVTVPSFAGCVLVTPADPTITQLTCSSTTVVGGTISVVLDPDLIYSVTGPTGFTAINPITGPVTNLAAGTYIVSVEAASGFELDPSVSTTWPLTVDLAPIDCVGTPLTPVVGSTPASCTPSGLNTISAGSTPGVALASAVTAASNEIDGQINIALDSHIIFKINGIVVTSASTSLPDDTYLVTATLTPAAAAAGFTFAANAQTSWTIVLGGEFCPPTLATWHSGASGSAAVCSASGSQTGTITVEHDSGEAGKVTYTVVNIANGKTIALGSTTATVRVAPGSYKVEATPTDPADGLAGNTGSTNEIDYTIQILAAATACGDLTSLAFTGGTIGWLGFVLAGGMLFLGIALLFIRRRNGRSAE